jgi:hypothetical protein
MPLNAFQPQGPTLILPSTLSAATTMQPSTSGNIQGLMVTNLSTNDAYAVFSTTGLAAVAPTTAVPAIGHTPILQRATYYFTVPPNCFVSAITTAGQANLALTPGFGL